jgi:uncharacterized protein YgbK (DUF1537 family)
MTGGSAIAQHWAKVLKDGLKKSDAEQDVAEPTTIVASSSSINAEGSTESGPIETRVQNRSIVLAGSCSTATRAQIAEFGKSYPVLKLDIASSTDAFKTALHALSWIDEQEVAKPLLVCSGASEDAVNAAREARGEEQAAQLTELVFATIATKLTERGFRRIIVAGGETSGAVMNALNIQSVRIGKEIAPGVPWVTTFEPPYLTLALKSGNFGGPRFFYNATENGT